MTIIYLLRGNTMATKNLIVHTLWIIQMYEIPRAKPPIQNCLGYLFRERVGIIFIKIFKAFCVYLQKAFVIDI